ncbi:MAG TPA: hypothetical protein VF136_06525 [Methylomirabilota bacterium]
MLHPLVTQLRFARREWIRGLKAVTAAEAARRFGSINPIAWMIGHADPYLDGLAGSQLTRRWRREPSRETPGTKLHRTAYHYWFHLGESQAIRQLLGHTRLPDFVGSFGTSQYRPEC